MERENQTIIRKDFTQICSPSQVLSFKKTVIRFSAVPPIAVSSKCAGSLVTKTGLVTIAYIFSVLTMSVSVASSYSYGGGGGGVIGAVKSLMWRSTTHMLVKH